MIYALQCVSSVVQQFQRGEVNPAFLYGRGSNRKSASLPRAYWIFRLRSCLLAPEKASASSVSAIVVLASAPCDLPNTPTVVFAQQLPLHAKDGVDDLLLLARHLAEAPASFWG
jgi:hypothetical protein